MLCLFSYILWDFLILNVSLVYVFFFLFAKNKKKIECLPLVLKQQTHFHKHFVLFWTVLSIHKYMYACMYSMWVCVLSEFFFFFTF